jgi:hypothetical protein
VRGGLAQLRRQRLHGGGQGGGVGHGWPF